MAALPREPLQVVRAIRHHAVAQARQALGTCLAAEACAAGEIEALDAARRRDRQAADAVQDAHQFLEMFAARSAAMQKDRGRAVAALAAAQACSLAARVLVTQARSAEEAVEQLIAERAAAAGLEMARQGQHALDDMARTITAMTFRL